MPSLVVRWQLPLSTLPPKLRFACIAQRSCRSGVRSTADRWQVPVSCNGGFQFLPFFDVDQLAAHRGQTRRSPSALCRLAGGRSQIKINISWRRAVPYAPQGLQQSPDWRTTSARHGVPIGGPQSGHATGGRSSNYDPCKPKFKRNNSILSSGLRPVSRPPSVAEICTGRATHGPGLELHSALFCWDPNGFCNGQLEIIETIRQPMCPPLTRKVANEGTIRGSACKIVRTCRSVRCMVCVDLPSCLCNLYAQYDIMFI
jgi:hypothetical protein